MNEMTEHSARQEQAIEELEAQEKLQETNRELTAILEAEKQHTSIIGALSNVFYGMYFIDLEEKTLQEIRFLDNAQHMLGEKQNAAAMLAQLIDERVDSSYVPLMQNFMDVDTIDDRLGQKAIIIQEFSAKQGGWTRCSFFPVERDEAGKIRTVLCTLRWVTAEKEEIASQDNLIQALAIPYENIYAVNGETCEATCYRMGQAMNDR